MKAKICTLTIILSICILPLQQLNAQCTAEIKVSPESPTTSKSITFEAEAYATETAYTFNGGVLPPEWISSPYTIGSPCNAEFGNSLDNSSYFWATTRTNSTRFVQTKELNVTSGGNIIFDMRYGRDDPNPGCEDPDNSSEGVYLQYTTNGSTWTTIDNWDPVSGFGDSPGGLNLYYWSSFQFVIPLDAYSTHTMFRWYQPSSSGDYYDNWGLDNVTIEVTDAILSYSWDFGDGNTSTTINPTHNYSASGTYYCQLEIETVDGCTANAVQEIVIIPDNDNDGTPDSVDTDDDNDGTPDINDAFPFDDQEITDTDGDGIGNNADTDDDDDGVLDINDDFPLDPSETVDSDNDGIGNNADTDDDDDGTLDINDDLPLDPSETVDTDGDGIGNNADTDDDDDGVADVDDAFPLDENEDTDTDEDGIGNNVDAFPNNPAEWLDTDNDGIGNNADTDDDNDGVLDVDDAFPLDPARWDDSDGDGYGNSEDAFPNDPAEWLDTDNDGIGNNADTDDDDDGTLDINDDLPLDPSETVDTDGDGIGNIADIDDDDDGTLDVDDAFPLDDSEDMDTDNDGIGNNADTDDDDDGTLDINDAFPLDDSEDTDTDGDGIGNNADTDDDDDGTLDINDAFPLDDAEDTDTDGDGIGNNADTDDDDDGTPDVLDDFPLDNSEDTDTDGDGIGNNADTDDDDDGVLDINDAFPENPGETTDTDFDSIGDNTDTDDDNDGVPDTVDEYPLDNTQSGDADGDGIDNTLDTDDDGDGVPDTSDDFPYDPTESTDTDGDGYGDNVDDFPGDYTEWLDTDGDGIGNNTDNDDDNDNISDNDEISNGTDSLNADTDGDGVNDDIDLFPLDPSASKNLVSVIVGNKTKTYGEANPELTYTYTGFINGDDASDIDTPPTVSTVAVSTSDVDDYDIIASGAVDDYYDFSYTSGTLTINKALLLVTADSKTKVYGAENPVFTIQVSGFATDDNVDDLVTKPIATTTIDEATTAGTYAGSIIPAGGDDQNYSFSYIEGDFEVTQKELTVSGASVSDKTYDGTTEASLAGTETLIGVVNSDDVSLEANSVSAIFVNKDVGTDKSVTVTGYTIIGSDINNYTLTQPGGLTGNIILKELTISGVIGVDKVYDGNTNALLTGTATLTGVINSEDVDLDESSVLATFANINIGTDKTLTVAGYIITGTDIGNYTLTQPDGLTADITSQAITVTADASQNKVYGSSDPIFTYTVSPALVEGDSFTGALDRATGEDVGPYVIGQGDLSAGNNYSISFAADNFDITTNAITVSADAGQSKVYGETDPVFSYTVSPALISGDVFSGALNREAGEDVASYTINQGSLSAGTNYNISFITNDFTITKATLTVTADPQTKVYRSSNPQLTFQYSGWLNDDDETDLVAVPVISTIVDLASSVGVYTDAITLAEGEDENYDFAYVADDFTVTKATLTVTADPQTRVYGQANPALTFQYSGWLNDDDETDLVVVPVASTTVDLTTSVGVYEDAITLAEGEDENYDFAYVANDFTVLIATLTVTADPQIKVYGEANPALTFQYSGWLNDDDETSLVSVPVISTTVDLTTSVGVYEDAITLFGGEDENYDFAYVADDFSVTKATLTVSADAQTRVYGQANPALTFQYSGWLNGDDEADLGVMPVASTTVDLTTSVGVYTNAITLTAGEDENYDFAYVADDFTVTKATLTVTADAQTRVYGQANPALTFQYSGWLNDDDETDLVVVPVASTTVDLTTSVGVYEDAITLSEGEDENYDFAYVADDFTVTKATLTATADPQTKVYGEANPALTFQYSGWLNDDDETDLEVAPVISTTVDLATSVGVYTDAISLSEGEDENYDFAYVVDDFTVTKARLTVTADPQTKVYGSSNPALTFQYSGWLNGDDEADLVAKPVASTTVDLATSVGIYTDAITLSEGEDENYDFAYVADDFTVTKATLTVTADPQTKVYRSPNPQLTIQYSGWLNGDDEADLVVAPVASTTVDLTTSVGVYANAITLSIGEDENYDFAYVADDFAVTTATLTVTADPQTKVYGSSNPALTFHYSGWLNDEDETDLEVAPVISTTVDLATSVGVYANAITLFGGEDENYEFAYVADDFTVTKATLTATADPQTKVYGEANPTLTFQYSGWLNGDDETDLVAAPVASTTVDLATSVGVYTDAITLSEGDDENYEFAYEADDFTVTKARLIVTADSQTKVYGEANPALTFQYSGWLNSDDETDLVVAPVASTTVDLATSVGVYTDDITLSEGEDENYEFAYEADDFTVTTATLTVTADSQSKVYGEQNPLLSISYSGFRNNDNSEVINEIPLLTTEALYNSNTGNYPIILSGGSDNNYDLSLVNGSLVIEKATLEVIADSKTKIYGFENPALTLTYSGFVLEDSLEVIDLIPLIETEADENSDVGTYDIDVHGAADTNYGFSYNKGTLTIEKADQTIVSFDEIPEGLRMTQEFQLNAVASSGLSVTFETSDPLIGDIFGDILEVKREGNFIITALQLGNHNWNPANPVTRSITTLPTFDNIISLITPNNDGMNDYWYITDLEEYGDLQVNVYNRLGQIVFHTKKYNNDWDGTWNGSPLPSASYYYIMKSPVKGTISGVVNIVR